MAISAQQFAELQRRVAGGKSAPGKAKKLAAETVSLPVSGVILGIDPSLRGTGYGVLRLAKPQAALLACGTLHCPATWTRSRCLAHIASALREVVREHRPDVCAIEGLFFAQNLQTALIMGEARGAALAVIAEALVPIYELAPRKVKQAIVGHGGAQKLADRAAPVMQRAAHTPGVVLRGPQPRAVLAESYARARAMLYLGDPGETFCLALAEAQACGLPCVVTPLGAVAERLPDGVVAGDAKGSVAETDEAFAAAAIRLLRDDAAWTAQHRAALARGPGPGWDAVAAAFEALAA